MQDKLVKIFQKVKYEPEANLSGNIWRKIIARDNLTVRFKLWAFGFAGLASLGGLIPVFKILFADFVRSGFFEYFSLIFSDTGSILSSWKEFVSSLMESLPVVSVVLTLSLLFICFLSLRYLMKQIGKNQLSLSI